MVIIALVQPRQVFGGSEEGGWWYHRGTVLELSTLPLDAVHDTPCMYQLLYDRNEKLKRKFTHDDCWETDDCDGRRYYVGPTWVELLTTEWRENPNRIRVWDDIPLECPYYQ